MATVIELSTKLEELQKELESAKEIAIAAQNKVDKLEELVDNTITQINTQELLDSIHKSCESNTVYKHAEYIGTSTKVFGQFLNSDAEFFALKQYVRWENRCFDLIITKIRERDINIKDDPHCRLTISHIKNNCSRVLMGFLFSPDSTDKEKFLIEELSIIKKTYRTPNMITGAIAFRTPCSFYAQKPEHRQKGNFGNYYEGESLVYSGYNYGDATRYAIIGIKPSH